MEEVWKNIPDYDGYQVSSYGRIKSLARTYSKNNIILKQLKINSGYYIVNLWKNNKCTHKLIHRLVAENFIENLDNKKVVNHKDGNKLNNNVDNLEWVTMIENTKHAIKNNLISNEHINNLRNGKYSSKKIGMYDKNMNLLKVFSSSIEAEKYLNNLGIKAHSSNIRAVCTGIGKTASGYIWRDYE